MSYKIFLIDSNSLITPYKNYYPFDFAPGFWLQIEQSIKYGEIAILDIVKREILQGNDSLKEWMDKLEIKTYIKHKESAIIQKYSEILQHIQNNPCYKISALHEWSKDSIADAWIIATAAVYNCTIVSFEKSNAGLNSKIPSKMAKIPDVAKTFEVETIGLFQMIRELGFKLQ